MVLKSSVTYTPAPADEHRRRRRRILLYSHDGGGLGHLRITLGVATALAKRLPDDTILLLTGSNQASAFPHPDNVDFVKLPSMPLRDLYVDLPGSASPPSHLTQVLYFREQVAFATIAAFNPDLLVVDHAPVGLFQELARSLAWVEQVAPQTRRALLMRDITFGAEQTKTIWSNEGSLPLLDRFYDRILVYGDQSVFDPVIEYGMSAEAAAKTVFVGYLTPHAARRSAAEVREELGIGDQRLIAVTVGGGGDGVDVLRAFVRGFAEHAPADVSAYVVTGPLLPAADAAEIAALASGVPRLRIAAFDADFPAVAETATVLVGMGGYNAMTEAVYCGKRAVTVPRPPGPEEQTLRAERFGRRGLIREVAHRDLSPETLWAAIAAELENGASLGPEALPFGGEVRIVDELVALLDG